jgi:HAD superfamily hydrolase (TIGR01490 family)
MHLALFDLDNTLLEGDSDHAWAEFLIAIGELDAPTYRARNDEFYGHYRAGTLDIHAYLRFALSTLAGRSADELTRLHARFMHERVEAMIRTPALKVIEQHAQDVALIITATNRFVTEPIAKRLGVPDLIACEAEIRPDGTYTGEPIGIPSFRDGKVIRLDAWLAERGQRLDDFERSYFYSDSHNDLALLAAVTDPIVVDPDPKLAAVAHERGWPIISLRQAA